MTVHIIRTYHDNYKIIRYCRRCGLEEDDARWSEPCAGKVVDKEPLIKMFGKEVDKTKD